MPFQKDWKKLLSDVCLWMLLQACVLCGCSFDRNDISEGADEEPTFESVSDIAMPDDASQDFPNIPSPEQNDSIGETLAGLSLEQKVAMLFIVSPEALSQADAVTSSADISSDTLARYPVSGICWFSQNLISPEQTTQMIGELDAISREACGMELLDCVDEEGGQVARISGDADYNVTAPSTALELGTLEDEGAARETGAYMASYLSPLGFDVDFAPVCDVVSDEYDVMYGRSFGGDPLLVARMASAEIDGLQQGGIFACAKHFPGIGGAIGGDSHENAIYIPSSADDMRIGAWIPFSEASRHGVAMVMVGHAYCETLDTEHPSSLSHAVISDVLRGELGYSGVIITDSQEMGAITQNYSCADAAVQALQAGADIVLMPQDFEEAYNGVLDALRRGDIDEQRIDESARRIVSLRLASG